MHIINPSLGRFRKGLPNTNDLIHLRNNGIKRFVLNLKNNIMHKTSSQARTQPSYTGASQPPFPTSTAPWQHWSIPNPQTASCLSPPQSQLPSQPPFFVGPPVHSSFFLPAPGSGYYQNSNTMYQSLYPSLAYDGYHTSARCREACHGCNKNILKHNSCVVCKNCDRICHAKCAKKIIKFDFIEDSWSCWECCSKEETRYNPFKSFRYDKYSHLNNNSFNEIKQIENILDNCSLVILQNY